MTSSLQIERLVNELNNASEAYYNTGQPIMSDTEFDSKLNELQNLESETGIILSNSPTQNVGSVVLKTIPEVIHKTPMLSLDKCHSVEEIIDFAKGHDLVASVKLDGISCRLIYQDGELIRAESRGNGEIGNDITEHAKQFRNVPLHINKEGTYVIDGEALIKLNDFKEVNKDGEYKNSRNLTAGTLSSLDTSVVKDRKISWYAWEIVEGAAWINESSFFNRLAEANSLGFNVVPNISEIDESEYNTVIDRLLKIAEDMHLPQDGVVFKFDDIKYGKSLGNTNHHFRNGIAWKAPNNDVITYLKDIEFTMGKTGILTPTAVFEPVLIDGSTVERASLHNISIMRDILHHPYKGQKVAAFKSNLIIPQLRWGEKALDDKSYNYIDPPSTCPICGGKTEIVKENESEVLICTNPTCVGKLLGRLSHAVSHNSLNIDGLSEATIDKFISLGWLKSIKDIYHLKDYEHRMKNLEGFGSKSVTKLLDSIEKSRKTTLDRFLYSLSVPLLGKTASKAIAQAEDYNFNSFIQDMIHPGAEFFRHISGVGDSLINSLNQYFSRDCYEIYTLAEEFEFQKPEPIFKMLGIQKDLTGKTFVITGNLEHFANRDEAKAQIESLGGKVSGSVSTKTSYLVNNDPNSTSSKNVKAQKLGIPIITEQELLSMIS